MAPSQHSPPARAHLGDCVDEVRDEGSLSQHGERPDQKNGYMEYLSIVRTIFCLQFMREELAMVCVDGDT